MATGTFRVEQPQMIVESVVRDNLTATGDTFTDFVFNSSTVPVTKSGYIPIGIVGCQVANATTDGTRATFCFIYGFRYDAVNTRADVWLRNTHASNAKIKITIWVLYQHI